MDLHLEGKVVILTGGFKGIGKGIALRLAKEGAIVAVVHIFDDAIIPLSTDRQVIEHGEVTHHLAQADTAGVGGGTRARRTCWRAGIRARSPAARRRAWRRSA